MTNIAQISRDTLIILAGGMEDRIERNLAVYRASSEHPETETIKYQLLSDYDVYTETVDIIRQNRRYSGDTAINMSMEKILRGIDGVVTRPLPHGLGAD